MPMAGAMEVDYTGQAISQCKLPYGASSEA